MLLKVKFLIFKFTYFLYFHQVIISFLFGYQIGYVSHVPYMGEVTKIIFSFTFYNKTKLDALTLVLHFANYF